MSNYRNIVNYYLSHNKGETNSFQTVYAQLEKKQERYLIDRKNFVGHFTASLFVLSAKDKKIFNNSSQNFEKISSTRRAHRYTR